MICRILFICIVDLIALTLSMGAVFSAYCINFLCFCAELVDDHHILLYSFNLIQVIFSRPGNNRIFETLKNNKVILQNQNPDLVASLKNYEFIQNVACIAHVISHLNELNLEF